MGTADETTVNDLDHTATRDDLDIKASDAHVEEVVLARLTEEDVYKLSKESFTFRSWAAWRICLIMFVQGCNQVSRNLRKGG